MRQILNYGDVRQTALCAYCAGPTESRDHVPSRVLLDQPYPSNLPVVPACDACNQSFSGDEEYVACLIECARVGTTDPGSLQRDKIRRILEKKPRLLRRLNEAQLADGGFVVETERVLNVVLKLGRGHALFELNDPQRFEPESIGFSPIEILTPEVQSGFEQTPAHGVWPEVGSRGFRRLAEDGACDWIVVQDGRYRYLSFVDDRVVIRCVLCEYLACEVVWV